MSLTTTEAEQYIRLTLKQWGMSHVKIEWMEGNTFLGLANPWIGRLKLNTKILNRFSLFHEVLKHEIVHFIQFKRNGNKFLKVNGRWSYHGADFKAICKEMNIPARTRIPI